MSLILSRRDLNFLLHEWLDVERLTQVARYTDHSRETFDAALDTCEKIATDLFAPHNKKSDQHEPQFDGESVTIIPEVQTALKAFCDAGLMAAGQDYEFGGMQLPLERVRHFFPDLVSWQDEKAQAIPNRCIG